MISYYSFTKVTRVKDFRWNEIFDEFAYFITRCPHFREHRTSRKVHHFSLCLSSSFFFISTPHAKTISRSLHSCWCCNSSARFTSFLHRQHGTSSWSQRLTWRLASSRGNSSLHQTLCFLKVQHVTCKQVLQNPVTECYTSDSCLSQLFENTPRKTHRNLWPRGVTISALRTGFF